MRPILVSGLLAAAAMLTAVALGVAVLLTVGGGDGGGGHGEVPTMAAALPDAARVIGEVHAMGKGGRIRGAGIRLGGAR